jgi:hypothetical protein
VSPIPVVKEGEYQSEEHPEQTPQRVERERCVLLQERGHHCHERNRTTSVGKCQSLDDLGVNLRANAYTVTELLNLRSALSQMFVEPEIRRMNAALKTARRTLVRGASVESFADSWLELPAFRTLASGSAAHILRRNGI